MSIDLTEPTTPIKKWKNLHSDLFVKDLFDESDLPPEHKQAKTYYEVKCFNCNNTWFKIDDSNIGNLWHYLQTHHQDKDPRSKKAKNLSEGQSTLDEFVGQTVVPSKVSDYKLSNFKKFYTI